MEAAAVECREVVVQDDRTKRVLDSFDGLLERMTEETERLERVAARLEREH